MKLRQKLSDVLSVLLGRRFAYSIRYYHNRKRWPDFDHPKNLSEILISRILSNYFDRYACYVDKVMVRAYIKEKGLEEHLLKHYHYWDDATKIQYDELPDKFVLKMSNGFSGKNIFVCRDKTKFDLEEAKSKLQDAFLHSDKFESQYYVYPPQVICEELIDTGSDAWPTDYKFTCIHGKPVDIFVGTERERGVKFCTRNLDWSELNYTRQEYLPSVIPEKPKQLNKMIEIAKILSADFDFVRVDLYEYNDKVYFGELTFSPWGGIMYSYTDEAINEYGRLLRETK